ncbi:MAM domain-containing protein [Trichonephila clavipes]|nr:MAM domain-containing protein [Trichonephila clavipes]
MYIFVVLLSYHIYVVCEINQSQKYAKFRELMLLCHDNSMHDFQVLKREGTASNSTLWVMQGDQKKTWKKGMAIIQPTVEEYQIVFQGIIGNGTDGFMAIDDIRIRKGELCKITPHEAEPIEDNLSTTYEPFNYTYDFITSSEPSNYTYDFKTSSEPSNYTYDFNTTYEPINSTYYRTASTPAQRTTLKLAVSSSIRVAGGGKCEDTVQPRASQRFSMGLRSGEYAGHAIRATPSLSRTSSRYRTAVTEPRLKMCRLVRYPTEIPGHTIMLPPRNA